MLDLCKSSDLVDCFLARFAGHDFGGEDPFATGFDLGDETAEDRVAREAAEALQQRTAREGDITMADLEEQRKATPTPSEQQRDEDDQPPTKKPRVGRKPKVSRDSLVDPHRTGLNHDGSCSRSSLTL